MKNEDGEDVVVAVVKRCVELKDRMLINSCLGVDLIVKKHCASAELENALRYREINPIKKELLQKLGREPI